MKSFKEGRTNTEDAPRSGRPRSPSGQERQERIQELLRCSSRVSINDISAQLNIPFASVGRLLRDDLCLVSKLGEYVPHSLSPSQKEKRVNIAHMNLSWLSHRKDDLRRFICLDESWVEFFTPLQRHQARSWVGPGTSAEPIPRAELHERKVSLIVGMDVHGVAFWKTYEENITMTAERCKSFLEEYIPKWAIHRNIRAPVLLHDNARPHKAYVVQELIEDRSWIELPHPPYSPDMNPCDFNCFGHLKRRLSGHRYSNKPELDSAINTAITSLNEDGTFNGVNDLPSVWQRVIDSGGDY
ncbi:histone-lysine N-methyltransferase SETMAR-like [Neodiprion pinetum]|uniref:histone-lysine N-methyltransferase SETMAR-like n=1 Tax=Neodiprion pinetum TaxID=441929 RepID=UPI0037100618